MQIVYAGESAPQSYSRSVFLAGPTPRQQDVASWRPDMIHDLDCVGYDGVVFVPERRDRQFCSTYIGQVEWERQHLEMADRIIFWVPRNLDTMPAMTTNVEFGRYIQSGKCIYGRPDDAPKNRYLDWLYEKETGKTPLNTVYDVATIAKLELGSGAERRDGERCIPLDVWDTRQFQEWYKALKAAGNRLDDARVLWMFKIQKINLVFAYALWAKVWIEKEKRYKENEFVISRPDIAVVFPWYSDDDSNVIDPFNTKVVLINEFRSPVRNSLGMVVELPGGSSFKGTEDIGTLAAHELKEETGLEISSERFYTVGHRQLVSTLSSHKACLIAVKLNEDEIRRMEKKSADHETFGVAEDTEKTYIAVKTVGEILKDETVDWSMLGMIFAGLS